MSDRQPSQAITWILAWGMLVTFSFVIGTPHVITTDQWPVRPKRVVSCLERVIRAALGRAQLSTAWEFVGTYTIPLLNNYRLSIVSKCVLDQKQGPGAWFEESDT
jgi:hypothetical protein